MRSGLTSNSVDLLKMPLDLPHRHAARVHRDDLVIKAGEAALAFLDKLRLEAAIPITRHIQIDYALICEDALGARPVTLVGLPDRPRVAFWVSQMNAQFRTKGTLDDRLL